MNFGHFVKHRVRGHVTILISLCENEVVVVKEEKLETKIRLLKTEIKSNKKDKTLQDEIAVMVRDVKANKLEQLLGSLPGQLVAQLDDLC